MVAGREVLAGQCRGLRAILPFIGPALIISVAYMDPGNFVTNIQAGAQFGYELLWVVLLANIVAMLFQALSARLGIVTGHNLAELCRMTFPKPVVFMMWIASEIAAMATDLAELLGAAIGLALLLHLSLLASLLLAGLGTYIILALYSRGFRPMEIVIGALVSLIGFCYLAELIIAPPDWWGVLYHTFVPHLQNNDSILLAVGIVGATVMPHAIFLHSSLTRDRLPVTDDRDRRTILRYSNREVLLALGLAGLVNMAMIAMATSVFNDGIHDNVASIETAYQTLIPLLGMGAATVFMVALLASGFSSSVVGTIAGQVIIQGFTGYRIPVWVRRLVTMVPSVVIVMMGVDVTHALVLSQVVLSFVLPLPMITLLILTSDRQLMGVFVNSRAMTWLYTLCAVVVIALNAVLVLQCLPFGSFFQSIR